MKNIDKTVTSKNKGKISEKSLKKLRKEKAIEFSLSMNLNSKNSAKICNNFLEPISGDISILLQNREY